MSALSHAHVGRASPLAEAGRKSSRAQILHRAAYGLALASPEFSARTVATRPQLWLLSTTAIVLISNCVIWPALMAQVLVTAMSIGFLTSLTLRTVLACLGRFRKVHKEVHASATIDGSLPLYTVLLPLYHEAEILPQLAGALAKLNYPRDRLDVKYIVEEDDLDTRRAAEDLHLHEIVVVPKGRPRTKPKACNYALYSARGEFLVIYDAEDRPEPDQLRKAVGVFRAQPDVACFQARLAADNGDSAWLARMFALDYGVWFHTLLPGLSRLHAPIPLGGTSNHFRTDALVGAGGWDPFNVTEDADLGYRMARLGRTVSMLDSTTFEEAPCEFGPWLRQRTRWMKGYMQTVLVHTRDPGSLLRDVGMRGCVVMQAFLGGAIWSALVNPLLWVVFILASLGAKANPDVLDILAWTSGLTLLLANGLLAVLSLLDRHGRIRLSDLPAILTYPAYWMLISVAAYRALWQLVRDPFRWEKTPHGQP